MLSSGTWPHRPFRDVTARLCRQTSLTRTNKPKITNYSCRIKAAMAAAVLVPGPRGLPLTSRVTFVLIGHLWCRLVLQESKAPMVSAHSALVSRLAMR
jgi:hypothetical protein